MPAMPSMTFNGKKGELRIRLDGLTEAEAYQTWLALGVLLRQFSAKGWACLGHTMVQELTGKKHDRLNSAGVQPTPCLFCAIAAKKHAASEGQGEPPQACPF
jgi:hypothetical protein